LAKKTLANLSPAPSFFQMLQAIGRKNFGEFVLNRQIRQSFLPPKFPLYGIIILSNVGVLFLSNQNNEYKQIGVQDAK